MTPSLSRKNKYQSKKNHSNKSSAPPLDCVTEDDPKPAPETPNAPNAPPLFPLSFELPHNPVIAFSFSKSLIDLPADALAGLAVPDPSDSDHRSSKFALGFAAAGAADAGAAPTDITGFAMVAFAMMGNVAVRCTDVGFRAGTPPNKLGPGAGAELIIGLLEIGAPNMV